MAFDELKKAISESKLLNDKTQKEPIEIDEEIEQVYLEETPWVDYALRILENFVMLGKYSGKLVCRNIGGASIGMGFGAIKLHKKCKCYSVVSPVNPIDNFTFILVEFLDDEKSVLALSDNSIVNAIKMKCTLNENLTLNEEEFEKLRLLIKGYNYVLHL